MDTTLMAAITRFPMIETQAPRAKLPLATSLSALDVKGHETRHRILKFSLNSVFRTQRQNALVTLLIDLCEMRLTRSFSSALTCHLHTCVTRFRRRSGPRFATPALAFRKQLVRRVLKAFGLVSSKTVRTHKKRRWQCTSKTSPRLVTCRLELHAATTEKRQIARTSPLLLRTLSDGQFQLS